jgi:hypothetical protein
MIKQLTLAFVCAALVNSPTPAETLNGQVSIDRNLPGSGETQQLNQDTPVPDADQKTIYRPGMAITINQYQATPAEADEIIRLLRENGLWSHVSTLRAEKAARSKRLNGNADQQLSALGLCWMYPSGEVRYVDPASDLSGKLLPGDIVLGIDGVPPLEAHSRGLNFGNVGEVVQLTFSHEGVVQTLPCKRQPIANFTEISQAKLNWGALRN